MKNMAKVKLVDKVIEKYKKAKIEYTVPEDKEEITIGRGRDNDIVIPHRGYRSKEVDDIALMVSGRHCKIYRKGNELTVMDTGSQNGIYIDKEVEKVPKDERRELKHGSILRLGKKYALEVRVEGAEPFFQVKEELGDKKGPEINDKGLFIEPDDSGDK